MRRLSLRALFISVFVFTTLCVWRMWAEQEIANPPRLARVLQTPAAANVLPEAASHPLLVSSLVPRTRIALVLALDGTGDLKPSTKVSGGFLYVLNVMKLLLRTERVHHVHYLPIVAAPATSMLRTMIEAADSRVHIVNLAIENVHVQGEQVHVPGLGAASVGANLALPDLAPLVTALRQRFQYDLYFLRSRERVDMFSALSAVVPMRQLWVHCYPGSQVETAKIDATVLAGGMVVLQSRLHLSTDPSVNAHQVWIPPMFDFPAATAARTLPPRRRNLCYIGAFGAQREYLVEDMVAGWQMARETLPDIAFHVILGGSGGNRIPANLRERIPGLTLQSTGVDHATAIRVYRDECDVGARGLRISEAAGDVNQQTMVSTKVIEMAALALPIILNPQTVNQDLLGADYPLFWNQTGNFSAHNFAAALVAAFSNGTVYEQVLRAFGDHSTAVSRKSSQYSSGVAG